MHFVCKNCINKLSDDKDLYNFCKQNSFESIQKFSLYNNGKQWIYLLNLLKIPFDLFFSNTKFTTLPE